jgi:hypothetical protein
MNVKKITMKKILLSLGVIAFAINANAQFLDAKDSVDFAAFSTVDLDMDGVNWKYLDLTSAGTQHDAKGGVMYSESWDNAALTPDNLLVSPVLDLTTAVLPYLTWSVGAFDPDYFSEKYSVYITSDPNLVDSTTLVFTEILTAAEATTAQFRYVDMSGYAGDSVVYVVFRHYDVSDVYAFFVDDIIVESGTVSIEENSAISVSAYPNPAVNELNISASEEIVQIEILSLDGKVIKTSKLTKIDVKSLTGGIYIYRVVTVSGKISQGNFVKN